MTAAIPSQRHISHSGRLWRGEKTISAEPTGCCGARYFPFARFVLVFYYTANADRPYITAVVLTALVYQREMPNLSANGRREDK